MAESGAVTWYGGQPSAGPGWHPDPSGSGLLRWWDGHGWTDHTAPAYGPPPSSGPFVPRTDTSGYAVASLVLSVLWLGGVGALLAVVFGARARRDIQRSQGRLGGEGMATAGFVIGIVGIVGAVVLWTVVAVVGSTLSSDVHRAFTPRTISMGQTAVVDGSPFVSGVRTVTVYSFSYPVASQDPFQSAAPVGDEFAVADVQVCAGNGGSPGVDLFDFSVVQSGGAQDDAISAAVRNPSLTDLHSLAPNQCARGFVPFQMATGSQPVAVQFGVINAFRWAVSTSAA